MASSLPNLQVPVRHRAVWRRVNRVLSHRGQVLCQAQSPLEREQCGFIHRWDLLGRRVLERDVDLERLARAMGVLPATERLAPRRVVKAYRAALARQESAAGRAGWRYEQFDLPLRVVCRSSSTGRLQVSLGRLNLPPTVLDELAPRLSGMQLRELRQRLGLSPHQLAAMVGHSESAVVEWERAGTRWFRDGESVEIRLVFGWLRDRVPLSSSTRSPKKGSTGPEGA